MTAASHKIAFLGTPRFATVILDRLAGSAFRPGFVLTEPDKPVGRRQILTPPPAKLAAHAFGLPVAQPATPAALLAELTAYQPDLVVVAAYGRILRPSVLALAKSGFLNVHASLLPRYRGASPVQAVLLAGDQTTGVSLMQIDAGLDTGPVLARQIVPILLNDTTPTLSDRLAHAGGDLLLRSLPAYLAGELRPQPQVAAEATTTNLITKADGRLNGRQSPTEILRMLRAYQPWPGVWFEIDTQRVILLAAHAAAGQLIPDRVQLAGKQPVDWTTITRDRPALASQICRVLNRID